MHSSFLRRLHKLTKVSVIIPVFNVENFLEECLDSVIHQTFNDIEIICVNDASTDSSAEILDRFAQKDSRIKVITQPKGGISKARNTGLEIASGKFVYFLDSDDYIEPTLIEKNVQIMDEFGVDFVNFESEEFGVKNERIHKYLQNKHNGLININYNSVRKTNIQVWNKFYRKSLIDEWNLKFIDGLIYEDIFFNWIYFLKSKSAYYLSETLHHYRIRTDSIMTKSNEYKDYQKALHHLYNFEKLIEYFSNDDEVWVKNEKHFLKILNQYYKRTLELSPADRFEDVTEVYKKIYEKVIKIYIDKHHLKSFFPFVKFFFMIRFHCVVMRNRGQVS